MKPNDEVTMREKRNARVADLCRRLRLEGSALCMTAAWELEHERRISNARLDMIEALEADRRRSA